MPSEGRRIEKPRLLLVEGKEDVHLCEEILKYLKNNDTENENYNTIQIWNYYGIHRERRKSTELSNLY